MPRLPRSPYVPEAAGSASPQSLAPPSADAPCFADVIVPRHLRRAFTYRIPDRLRDVVKTGMPVKVPFGHVVIDGLIIALFDLAERGRSPVGEGKLAAHRLKDILSVQDTPGALGISPDLLELTRRIADYYLCPWGQCLRLVLPPSTSPSASIRYRLTERGRNAVLAKRDGRIRFGDKDVALLEKLLGGRSLTPATLARTLPSGPALVRRAVKHGWIETDDTVTPRRSRTRDVLEHMSALSSPTAATALQLDVPWQGECVAALDKGSHRAFLIQGPLQRQWDVMLAAADEALRRARTALIICASIPRAEALAALANARCSETSVVLHSAMAPGRRSQAWERIQRGEARLIVGTRIALFTPLKGIGMIAVEAEDSPTHKEESEPLYHAREVARMRAEIGGAVLLLGSAHPSLETWASLGVLPPPALPVVPASVETVDMRATPHGTVLSAPLIEAVRRTVEAGQHCLLLLNRRGFAPALYCRECGGSPRCGRCRVPLAFSKHHARLGCRYCGAHVPLPDVCPDCHAARLEPSGIGIEQVEEAVRREFRKARVESLDRETAPRRRDADAVRRRLQDGQYDVLVGTQMILQGPPLPPVGLVGLVQADAGLHRADFRAGERTYHLLREAAELARRDGRVILQTYLPDHPVIAALGRQDSARFYAFELESRRMLGYPPFVHLINLRVTGIDRAKVEHAASDWRNRLTRDSSSAVSVLGPVPGMVAQLRGRHRYQLLVKSQDPDALRRTVRRTVDDLERLPRHGLKYEVDVDPVELA